MCAAWAAAISEPNDRRLSAAAPAPSCVQTITQPMDVEYWCMGRFVVWAVANASLFCRSWSDICLLLLFHKIIFLPILILMFVCIWQTFPIRLEQIIWSKRSRKTKILVKPQPCSKCVFSAFVVFLFGATGMAVRLKKTTFCYWFPNFVRRLHASKTITTVAYPNFVK